MASNQEKINGLSLLDGISEEARVWIFQSDMLMTPSHVEVIQQRLDEFLPQWTSHNRALLAKGSVVHDRFVVIALDEQTSTAASGCSIDSMTHQIQAIAASLSINLQDRTTFYFRVGDSIISIPMNQLSDAYQSGQVDDQSLVFDNLIKTKGELFSSWLKPLGSSWHSRFI